MSFTKITELEAVERTVERLRLSSILSVLNTKHAEKQSRYLQSQLDEIEPSDRQTAINIIFEIDSRISELQSGTRALNANTSLLISHRHELMEAFDD